MLKYKYVFFDTGKSKNHRGIDTEDYFYISTQELRKDPNIIMVSYPLDYVWDLIRISYVALTKIFRNTPLQMVLEKIGYPFYFKNNFSNSDKVCFIVYGYYITPKYLHYLKKKYPNCKIVKLHRDSYIKWRERNPEFSDDDMASLFDVQFSFDKGDSETYNMVHFDDFCTKVDDIKHENACIHDVFFAGAAKDRMETLISVYDHLEQSGVDCYFYVTNCKIEERIDRKGIEYANDSMSYKKMLYHTVNSKVILEINQKGVDGYTSRFLESVMYNKKLITNNKAIMDSPYYNSKGMMCFDKVEDIKVDFISGDYNINYNYKGEFSPMRLIERMDDYLDAMK